MGMVKPLAFSGFEAKVGETSAVWGGKYPSLCTPSSVGAECAAGTLPLITSWAACKLRAARSI